MQRLFRFTFRLLAPLTSPQANLVLPAVRALMKREGLEPNYGQLDPEGEHQWMMSGWTADRDYDVFLDRYPGGSIEVWQKSVEEAIQQIVAEANPAARASCEWRYSDDEDFHEDAYDE